MDARDLIRRHEGFRARLYDDATGQTITPGSTVTGHPTIGYGCALDVRAMPEWIADLWCRDVLAEIAADLHQRLPWFGDLDPVRRATLIDMAYQLGVGGLFLFRRMLNALEAQDYVAASAEALLSRAAQQTPRRWQELSEMLRTGEWPAGEF